MIKKIKKTKQKKKKKKTEQDIFIQQNIQELRAIVLKTITPLKF